MSTSFSQQHTDIFPSFPPRTVSQLLNATSHVLQQPQVHYAPSSPPRRQVASPTRPPMPDELASVGIKVRDFAYESKLPPVPPYRRPQLQPAPQSPDRLCAMRQATEEDMCRPASSHIGRVVTEPVGEQSKMDVDLAPPAEITDGWDDDWYTPQSQPPLMDSQESNLDIDTPLVTPNGSLQWIRDNSSLSASQLDTESQQPAPEMLSYEQLGFSQPDDGGMNVNLAPAFSRKNDSRLPSPLTPLSSLSLRSSTTPSPPLESPRYNFRKRPSPPPQEPTLYPTIHRSRPMARRKATVSPKPRPVRKSARSNSRKRDTRT